MKIVEIIVMFVIMVLICGCMAVFHCGCEPYSTITVDKSTYNHTGDIVNVNSNSNSTIEVNKDVTTTAEQ